MTIYDKIAYGGKNQICFKWMFEQISFSLNIDGRRKINNIYRKGKQNKTEKTMSDFLWNYKLRTKSSFSKYCNKYIFFSSYQVLFEGTQ